MPRKYKGGKSKHKLNLKPYIQDEKSGIREYGELLKNENLNKGEKSMIRKNQSDERKHLKRLQKIEKEQG